MQTLTDTLLAAQKTGGKALYKAVFTKTGQTTRTYGCDTTNRILHMAHPESEWSQQATILIDNRDGNLTALDLTGYLATISYGYNTNAGDEYKAKAPLEVIEYTPTTLLRQTPSDMLVPIKAVGVFDMMAEDEASTSYSPESTNTDTVKTILTAIAGATMACFSHCKAYTITYDSEDSLIGSFIPADFFSVSFKESRLSAFKKALKWTRCKARIENTSDVATIHVFLPRPYSTNWVANTAYSLTNKVTPTTANGFDYICTTGGTSHSSEPTWSTTENSTVTETGGVVWTIRWYDYEYNDAITKHNFFEKSVRNRLVIPNRVYVQSHPDQGSYTGNAVDATSYSALGRYINQYHWLRVTSSDPQCIAIATAILQKYQIGQERGHGSAPLNCGQEVMDYIKITDSVANDTRTGNIGYLNRTVEPGKFEFEFRFGDPEMGGVAGLLGLGDTSALSLAEKYGIMVEAYESLRRTIDNIIDNQEIMADNYKALYNYLIPGNDVHFKKQTVSEQTIIPVWS